jgi:tRNA nucleotidyltransferase (CCA-adding enzyme)
MGRHLLELGVQPGPDMGRLLDECYEAQLDGIFSSLGDGLAFARQQLGLSHHL